MTDNVAQQIHATDSPGKLLRAAREAHKLSERETADRLNWMPDYVAVIERDDYDSLRAPAFARGYVKAYAQLLGLDEKRVLDAFDHLRGARGVVPQTRIETRPLQLQHTGRGVVIGLAVLFLLGFALWWGQRDQPDAGAAIQNAAPDQQTLQSVDPGASPAAMAGDQ